MTKEKEQDEIIPSPSYLDSCVKTSFDFPDYPLTTSKVFRTGRPSISAPHSRSCSMRKVNRDKNALLIDRKRRNSLPMDLADLACPYISSDIQSTCESSQDTFQRVRSFKMTSKGLVNHGDSLRNKSKSKTSSRSSSLKDNRRQRISSDTSDDTCSSVSSCSGGYYRVVILGSPSVGKTALMNQFMTSEYTGGLDLGTGMYKPFFLRLHHLILMLQRNAKFMIFLNIYIYMYSFAVKMFVQTNICAILVLISATRCDSKKDLFNEIIALYNTNF